MASTSSYRTPHEVREAIDGMAGDDWLQQAIEHWQWSGAQWCYRTDKATPRLGPPPLAVLANFRYSVVVTHLMGSGLNLLGKGCYGAVFELSPDDRWVYKLVAVSRNVPYLSYVRWAREMRTGPNKRDAWVRCLPRAKILFEDKWFALIRVERLVEQRGKVTAYDAGEHIAYTSTPGTPAFEPYLEATDRIKRWSRFWNDMHTGNIMLRPTKCGTYEPVHTDPVC